MAHKWGIKSTGSLVSAALSRAMGGTSPNIDDMEIESISIKLDGTTTHRLAVYTGGALDDPAAATLLWDAGEVTPSGDAWYTITHPSGGVSLPKNTIVWLAFKRSGAASNISYNGGTDKGDFQTTRGRNNNNFNQDPSVAFPTTYTDTGSFGNSWYSIYITYSVATKPKTFAIELRDKNFSLKGRIDPFVTSCQWEWNRIGGCGRARLKISGDYSRFAISADDDVRIYLPDGDGGADLWYRGYIQQTTPVLSGGDQSITIECEGYYRWLKRIIVHDGGDQKSYTNTEISSIVDDIIDTFIVPNSSITKGTIDASIFVPDTLSFKTTVREVLRTLQEFLEDIEYGVDENLQFFWRTRSSTVTHKFFVGDKVTKLSDKVDFNSLANKIFFEGGTVGGSTYVTSKSSSSSQTRYGKHEVIVSNGAITTESVANQYINGQFKLRSKPIRQMRVNLVNINKRIEETLPVGAISVIDTDETETAKIYGTTGNGGSNTLYGEKSTGGGGALYGGTKRDQFDRVRYDLSPEDGRVNAMIQFGNSLNYSKASATMRKIQLVQDTQRQRSL